MLRSSERIAPPELSQLLRSSERIAPLSASEEQARARLHELEALTNSAQAERSACECRRASMSSIDAPSACCPRSSQVRSSHSPCSHFFLFGAVPNFRARAPTELAYWLRVPVLASSSWPRRAEALDALVDELADTALAARGVVLMLPATEAERPRAATLSVQLTRAQRQFRSTTGSRVTIAQPWLGELGSSRVKRAAEAADRVLWAVAADAHRGRELRDRRDWVGRQEGVAALLVDADLSLATRVGSAGALWNSRSPVQLLGTEAQMISR